MGQYYSITNREGCRSLYQKRVLTSGGRVHNRGFSFRFVSPPPQQPRHNQPAAKFGMLASNRSNLETMERKGDLLKPHHPLYCPVVKFYVLPGALPVRFHRLRLLGGAEHQLSTSATVLSLRPFQVVRGKGVELFEVRCRAPLNHDLPYHIGAYADVVNIAHTCFPTKEIS